MTLPLLSIRPAPLADLTPVLRASSLASEARGLPMWTQESLDPARLEAQYPGAQGYAGRLQDRLADRVAERLKDRVAEQPVAVMLLVASDPVFWPGDPPGEALYLHKLAVHPDWQGLRLSAQMVEEAARLTRAAGRPWLRLDTAAERPRLRNLYEDLGFRLVREGHADGWPAAWYELNVLPRGPGEAVTDWKA
ncbi:GNAT family N-acetyltransferase [Deinococcus altitudinis]|uniref:GNAT family N-acetyltransferase n=1 Tax=Deinococcus altitudinis TaxID=468914 RepID=UPI0038914D52